MKETNEIKITKKLNLNELARLAQRKTGVAMLAGVGLLVFVGWLSMRSHGSGESQENAVANRQISQMDGTIDSQFTQEASQKALETQQREIKELTDKLAAVNEQMEVMQKALDEKNQEEINDGKVAIQELQTKVSELEASLKKPSGASNTGLQNSLGAERGITITNFSYLDQKESTEGSIDFKKNKTVKDYVPPGTFAKAVLLSGADTNAGVHGQTDTIPITMRVLDNGTLPNGAHSSLKGCFVTAAAYGDASSERGQIRLQRLSCVRKPGGYILDIPIEGTINDLGGNDGIRGHVVMRNNKLIWNAGVSGFLSGLGNAMQQSATTQAVSPLGITSTIKSGKVFEHSAYGGANTALGKLADYYIKLADMYHPIVQIHAGSQVNIVFLKGFSLTEGLDITGPEKTEKADISKNNPPSNLMPDLKNSQLGQEININSEDNQ